MNKSKLTLYLVVFSILLACTNLAKRSLAQDPEARVTFYDSAFCEADACTERSYDLSKADDYRMFEVNLKNLVAASKSAKKSKPNSSDMDILIKFHLGHSGIAKGSELALEIMKSTDLQKVANDINEIFAAIKNNFKPPIDANFQFFYLPVEFFKRVKYNEVAHDDRQPGYLVDPTPSSFWRPQGFLDKKDLDIGFDRNQKNNYSKRPCNYDKPKSGFGVHPGFHIQCGDQKFKLKLGSEVHSSAFNSRVYHALGYNVPVVDFIDQPTIRYSRNILTEFNSRNVEHFRVLLADKEIFKYSNGHYYSPFEYIKEVVLENGIVIPAKDLKSNLFLNPTMEKPELNAENFNRPFEEKISLLVMVSSSYILKTKEDEIGAWRFDELSHENRRELRGLQLLAAWIGNFDMRMDNVRLVRAEENGVVKVKHMISDVGTGLGNAKSLLTRSTSQIEEMPWTVTETYVDRADGYVNERLEIIGLMNIEVNKAFRKMSFNDGQWMVAKLCQFTPAQLKLALTSSGLSSNEASLAFEKLISRRTKMVKDFKLEGALPSCLIKADTKLNSSVEDAKGFSLKNGHLINQAKQISDKQNKPSFEQAGSAPDKK